MISVFVELIVASKAISLPLASVSFSVMSASILSSLRAELSVFRTGSLKAIRTLALDETLAVPFTGVKVTVGATKSIVIEREVVAASSPVPKSIALRLLPISLAALPSLLVFSFPSCP